LFGASVNSRGIALDYKRIRWPVDGYRDQCAKDVGTMGARVVVVLVVGVLTRELSLMPFAKLLFLWGYPPEPLLALLDSEQEP
jgi:hypothetical protein